MTGGDVAGSHATNGSTWVHGQCQLAGTPIVTTICADPMRMNQVSVLKASRGSPYSTHGLSPNGALTVLA
ncbi:hypothetical protein PUN4_640052 [Paraburkholderia unamae]|nr:hypothetical protein PUN4_640052 [Paraburkholderia unamae]